MVDVGQRIYLSEWLQAEMNKRGRSQSDLAPSANLNRAVINKLLNGKNHPQPSTPESISRAFKIPVEITYRAAGLLPSSPDNDEAIEEAIHVLKSMHSAQRKATAIAILKVLMNNIQTRENANSKPCLTAGFLVQWADETEKRISGTPTDSDNPFMQRFEPWTGTHPIFIPLSRSHKYIHRHSPH